MVLEMTALKQRNNAKKAFSNSKKDTKKKQNFNAAKVRKYILNIH